MLLGSKKNLGGAIDVRSRALVASRRVPFGMLRLTGGLAMATDSPAWPRSAQPSRRVRRFDAGVAVPDYLEASTNTTPAIVLPDFFGSEGAAVRARHLELLDRARDLYKHLRHPRNAVNRTIMDEPDLRRAGVLAIWEDADVWRRIRAHTGVAMQLFPADLSYRISALLYSEPGDGIGPHFDGNPFRGRRLSLIYVLRDDADALLHMENEPLPTPEGSLVLFQGDRLRHSVLPRRSHGLRLVINVFSCETPCLRKPRPRSKQIAPRGSRPGLPR